MHEEDHAALRLGTSRSVLFELEAGKALLRSPANMASIRVFLAHRRQNWPKILKKHSGVTETSTKDQANIAELKKLRLDPEESTREEP